MIFLGYFFSILIVSAVYLALNKHFKWITKKQLSGYNSDLYMVGLIFGAIFWPIALLIIVFFGLIALIVEKFFPN